MGIRNEIILRRMEKINLHGIIQQVINTFIGKGVYKLLILLSKLITKTTKPILFGHLIFYKLRLFHPNLFIKFKTFKFIFMTNLYLNFPINLFNL